MTTIKKSIGKNFYIIRRFLHVQRGKPRVHFIHVGKTGGTALRNALKNNRLTPNHTLLFHQHENKLSDIPPGERFFFFLRDPIKRFVSGFYSRKRCGQPAYYAPWSSAEAAAFSQFHTPNELAEALTADGKQQQDAENGMNSIYHLRHSYLHWFISPDYFLARKQDIFHIGFQETLEADFSSLKHKLQLPDHLKLPQTPGLSHRNPQHFDRRLSAQAVRNLQKWYAADYQFLDLCRRISGEKHDIRH